MIALTKKKRRGLPAFHHIHSSSKFDRSAKSVRAAAEVYNATAELVTWTEVEREYREDGIRRANGDTVGFISGDKSDQNDCGISFRFARFELIYSEQFKATNAPFYLGGVKRLDCQYATTAVLRDKLAEKVLVVSVIHLASGVQGDLASGRKTRNTVNWLTSYAGTKKRANQLARLHHADGVMVVADWNIDFKLAWARALVKSIAPRFRLTWKTPNAFKGGTHSGGRIIDGTILRGAIDATARLWKDDDSSDHRPYIEKVVWR